MISCITYTDFTLLGWRPLPQPSVVARNNKANRHNYSTRHVCVYLVVGPFFVSKDYYLLSLFMYLHVVWSQRTILWNWFCIFTFPWVSRVELGSLGLSAHTYWAILLAQIFVFLQVFTFFFHFKFCVCVCVWGVICTCVSGVCKLTYDAGTQTCIFCQSNGCFNWEPSVCAMVVGRCTHGVEVRGQLASVDSLHCVVPRDLSQVSCQA